MGSCSSKPDKGGSGQLDLFATPSKEENNVSSATENTDTEGLDPRQQHNLEDEYAFHALEKCVFKPGTDCIMKDDAGIVCGRISSVRMTKKGDMLDLGQNKCLIVSLMTIKSNGKVFYRAQEDSIVTYFSGKKKLSELEIRPVLHEEKSKLRERGRSFAKYGLGAHYLMYSDTMIIRGRLGASQISSEGRVIVDAASFFHFNPDYGCIRAARRLDRDDPFGDMIAYAGSKAQSKTSSPEIPECNLHLCYASLCGFSLKTKRWGEIKVADLSEIDFSDDAFDKLVLDQESKIMVKSLVENIQKKEVFTDIIQGKGGGCVFLLHGPPGTGKTLTAEAVSELLHRPLYCIDVGELGITPENLEDTLRRILEVSERWNAVVLIDECDIFLASRSLHDVLRNAMVGIFLRLLEYYHGVLFLTSNRAMDLDEAFQSRISVSLEYKALDASRRKHVWSSLLSAAGITDLDVDKLGDYELNGRQIKTAIRLAICLAGRANEPLSIDHLAKTISYADLKHQSGDRMYL